MLSRIVFGVIPLLCTSLASSAVDLENLDSIDRGHRIILMHGLQIQALGFGGSGPAWWDDWDASGFTGREFGWDWDGQDPGAKE